MTVTKENYQLRLRLKGSIVSEFKKAAEGKNEVPAEIKKCCEEGYLAGLEEVEWLHANRKGRPQLHELLSECEVVLPSPEVSPRSPELEARLQRLRREQEEREYRAMTRNVDSVRIHHPDDNIGHQLRQINRQLIAVFQFVLSVVAGFMFGFLGIELMTGELEFGFRLLLGVIFALIIALAEIYFLAKKLAEEDDEATSPPVSGSQLPQSTGKLHAD